MAKDPGKNEQGAEDDDGKKRKGRRKKTLEALAAEYGMTKIELASICVQCILDGMNFEEAAKRIGKEYSIKLNRFQVRDFFLDACRLGYVIGVFPFGEPLANQIRTNYPWLERTQVVQAGTYKLVAKWVVEMLLGMLHEHRRSGRNEVHIGFAGGPMMAEVCRLFAQSLLFDCEGLPALIVLHSMFAGDDPEDTKADPNAFFSYFKQDGITGVKLKFVRFLASADIRSEHYDHSKQSLAIDKAFRRKAELDIILTSASCPHGHGVFDQVAAQSQADLDRLKAALYIGDFMGGPMGHAGPLDVHTSKRILTLMELKELPAFIAGNKKVLLAVAPCSKCHATKELILQAVLDQPKDQRLVTHVVLDSRTARGLKLREKRDVA